MELQKKEIKGGVPFSERSMAGGELKSDVKLCMMLKSLNLHCLNIQNLQIFRLKFHLANKFSHFILFKFSIPRKLFRQSVS